MKNKMANRKGISPLTGSDEPNVTQASIPGESHRRMSSDGFTMMPKRTSLKAQFERGGIHKDGFGDKQILSLMNQGFTLGLIKAIERYTKICPLRIWIVDNSSSMKTEDGFKYVKKNVKINDESNEDDLELTQCTRWEELQETVEFHANMAAMLKSPTVFRLINKPGRLMGNQVFGVANKAEGLIESDLQAALSAIRSNKPRGITPLCYHIGEITQEISELSVELKRNSQRIAVIIATDGIPTDEKVRDEFASKLKDLLQLPVKVTIRLCTDDEGTVNYYKTLDKEYELHLDVIDDYIREAQKVYTHNKMINYTLSLHRTRELGYCDKCLNILNIRQMEKLEFLEFCTILFGNEPFTHKTNPLYHTESFFALVQSLNSEESRRWNPAMNELTELIDDDQMKKIFGEHTCKIC